MKPEWLIKLCKEMLHQALKDLLNKDNFPKEYEQAKEWFELKSRKIFGYYFCLEITEWNPNLIRTYLTKHGVKYE